MEVNIPIALVCYERALPLPTSSPSMHNQLSNLTYLPDAWEAHGTGLAVVQRVPIYNIFSSKTDFLGVWISSLRWHWLTLRVWCVYGAQCTSVPAAKSRWAHTHTSTPAGTFLRTHTHRPKGEKGDQRKIKWPARVLMREGRASGIYLKPFLPPAALSGGL